MKEIEIKQNSVRNELAALKDERRLLLADRKRLKEMAGLLKREIEDTRRLLNKAEQHRGAARREARNEATAMTLLMLDNETRETRRRLVALQERLHLEVGRHQDDLTKALADNERRQSEKRDLLDKVALDLTNFAATRTVVQPMRSLSPAGAGKLLIVTLSLLAGVIGGVIAALLADFHAKVRAASKPDWQRAA